MAIEEMEGSGPMAPEGEATFVSMPALVSGTKERRRGPKPEPEDVRRYVRKRLAEALPEIADTLVKEAVGGGLDELKVLVQMSGIDTKAPPEKPRSRRTGRTLEQILLHDWRKEPLDGVGSKR